MFTCHTKSDMSGWGKQGESLVAAEEISGLHHIFSNSKQNYYETLVVVTLTSITITVRL